jgi:hypothetical protein
VEPAEADQLALPKTVFAWFWLGVGALLVALAGYQLVSSVLQAASSGLITVNSLGRGSARETVPWLSGWAYVVGFLLLLLAGCCIAVAACGKIGAALIALLFLPLGAGLCLFSAHLSTPRRTAYLLATFTVLVAILWLGKRFGRPVAILVWSLIVGTIVYLVQSSHQGPAQ